MQPTSVNNPTYRGKDLTEPGMYGIMRDAEINSEGKLLGSWHVTLKRNGFKIHRRFAFLTYGDEAAALVAASSYRDAALRLFPPQITAQRRLSKANTSGFAGVLRIVDKNGSAYWRAQCKLDGKVVSRKFAVKEYGEDRAKHQAILTRMDMLNQQQKAQALSYNPRSLVEVAVEPALTTSQVKQRLLWLDNWFDLMRPRYVSVRMHKQLTHRDPDILHIGMSDRGYPPKSKETSFSYRRRGWPDTLRHVWSYLQDNLQLWHDPTTMDDFTQRYEATFFALTPAQRLEILYRCTAPDDAQQRQTPATLVELLPDFVVPPLPAFAHVMRVIDVEGIPDMPQQLDDGSLQNNEMDK